MATSSHYNYIHITQFPPPPFPSRSVPSRRIYECNQFCKCGSSCTNRVVQNGLQHRLQVFHTGKSLLGWGLRALDDIPKGSFICTYVGNIYTEQNAEKVSMSVVQR